MYALVHVAVLAVTVFLLARYLPGIRVERPSTSIVVAVVFSLINFFLGWAIKALLFVPVVLTFGLLAFFVPFLVNTAVLWLTDKVLHAFEIRDTRTLLVASGVITAVGWLLQMAVRY
jgi:putative membrane protein